MPPPLHLDPNELDLNAIIATREQIRQVNLHRDVMEQLDAICLLDPVRQLIAGYRDVRSDEFWVSGHFPGYPVFPGILMCEAGAQLVCYYTITQRILPDSWVGFAGMDEVRFRSPVRPGDRLVLIGKAKRLRRLQSIFNVQGLVGSELVFHGDIIGVPLPHEGGG
jgi:3-hydroxyacyl-[acyl-carrier-protein] dehydratase